MTAISCGLDFGTSNSTVGWSRPGQPPLLALEGDRRTLPSAIFFHSEEPSVSYGRAALSDYLEGYEGRLMRSLKSLLGTSMMDESTEVMGRAMPFRELLAHFIGELKRRAETSAGTVFSDVVLGRPVFFIDDDPVADRVASQTLADIAQAAGFRHIEFQYEPIAAAFEYESTITREELVLVADIGGGTSDFALVRLGPQRVGKTDRRDDILASGGVHIGGTDFDKVLSLARVMPMLGLGSSLKSGKAMPSAQYFNLASWHTINFAYTRKALTHIMDNHRDAAEQDKLDRLLRLVRQRDGHWLAFQVEGAKIALSDTQSTCMDLDRIGAEVVLEIQRADFDAAVGGLVEKTTRTVDALLRSAEVSAQDIDTIFFTGGSSSIPLLREQIARLLPHSRSVEGDNFGSIGAGLARDAVRRFG